MRSVLLTFLMLFLPLSVLGCATAVVSSDYIRGTDFSRYKTFSWGAEQESSGDLRFDDPVVREAIKDQVAEQLEAKGLAPVGPGTGDLEVKYYITVEKEEDQMADYQMLYPPSYDPRTGVTDINSYATREPFMFQYNEGTFVLDMIDPKSESIVWRGSLEGVVDPTATQAKRLKRIPEAVAKVLAKYPPR